MREPERADLDGPGGTEGVGRRMDPRQLAAVFAYNLVIWTLGNGLLALLPIYVESLGADDFVAGLYLAITYVALTAGTFTAGRLHDRGRAGRRVLIASGAVCAPIISAVAFVGDLWVFVAMTAAVWYFGGIGLALTYIFAGRQAGPGERGRVMGTLALAAPLGSVIGGLLVGGMQAAWGYPGMWLAGGLVWFLCPAAGAFVRDESASPPVGGRAGRPRVPWRDRGFLLLLGASVLGSTAYFIASLGRSLAMKDFPGLDVTSTVTVAGLVSLPFPFLIGSLSDRRGRAGFLLLCYLSGVAGLLVYSRALTLPVFWAAAALMGIEAYASTAVGAALVTDVVPRDALGGGMAAYNATGWIGAIVGFLGGGLMSNTIGGPLAFLVGMGVMAGAVIMMVPLWAARRTRGGARARDAPDVGSRKG